MRYLLDTHTILWCTNRRDNKLSKKAEDIITNHQNDIYISSASLWEIAIKVGLGKLDINLNRLISELEKVDFTILHAENAFLKELVQLPFIHKDPFDRLLVATAISEDMTLITADKNIHKYNVQWVW